MKEDEVHPTERQLLMAADGELPAREDKLVRAHLAACWKCRTQLDDINRSIADLVHLRQNESNDQLPSMTRARLRLQAELARAAERDGTGKNSSRNTILLSKAAYAAAMVLLAVGFALIGSYRFRQFNRTNAVPRSSLTPGDALLMSKADVCSGDLTNDPASVPASLREAVFEEYGIPHARPQDYELDYLITPKLGGATSLRNLWPEPYSAKWNARVKDQLEDRLHSMVCRGEIDLATAQREIATDWVAAYRKYFHTPQPISRPW